jgi:hypothetical protein
MANRVTEAEVETLLDVDSDIDVDSFITTANLLVTQVLTGSGLSDELLAEIEKYLSAHMLESHPRLRQLTQEKFGDAAQSFAGKFGEGLKATAHGQMVLILDTSGRFEKVGKANLIFEAL